MEEAVCVVGVDWGEGTHSFAARCEDGVEHKGRLSATAESVHEWVRGLREQHSRGTIVIGLEQSRGALMYALQRYDFLELVPVNPRAANAYRKSLYLSGAKDDPTDAELIRDFVRVHRTKLRRWRSDDAITRKLRLLVEGRRTLVDQRTSTVQALTATLKQFFPQVLSWFGEADSRRTRAFLSRWPTLEAALRARPKAIRGVIEARSRKNPAQIEAILKNVRCSVALTNDPAIIDPLSLLATSYIHLLDALDGSITCYDQQIQQLWSEHPDRTLFASFPGGGVVMAPRLAVAFGTARERYEDASEMQRYSGIAPVMERSGKQTWVHARWQCPTFLRQTFHEYAAASLPFSEWALAYYRQQRERGAGHHAAIRSLAFRWIRILLRCWKNNVPYDERVHIESLKRRNSPLAARMAA